ncbi:hypothetical protein [Nannocystis radixulma]|uniref:Transposase n=1 Tax=Nannocystis radixulma TaxID=2995305 RepID=A0ABT5BK44_9BACT|nr:hypothetical protein [Nannocystis radixulma]MDC0674518.1 hypothetical protein [Nannocystis radixulma]
MKSVYFVGIDVGNDWLDVAVKAVDPSQPSQPTKRAHQAWASPNNEAGIKALIERLQQLDPILNMLTAHPPQRAETIDGLSRGISRRSDARQLFDAAAASASALFVSRSGTTRSTRAVRCSRAGGSPGA